MPDLLYETLKKGAVDRVKEIKINGFRKKLSSSISAASMPHQSIHSLFKTPKTQLGSELIFVVTNYLRTRSFKLYYGEYHCNRN